MKMMRRIFLASSALALSASLVGQVNAQNTPVLRNDNPPDNTRITTTTTDHISTVAKANKASDLIGMDVRNNQNEKLGDIKDLVLDLHSGKISYAVLSVGGFLGIGDKYVAVPPSAFSVAPDGKNLLLNADKAKIQNAPGFAKNEWPDLNTPVWQTHSSYWTPDTALGSPAATSTGTGTSELDRRTQTTLGTNKEMSFHGRITAVDTQANTFTVQGTDGTRVFKFGGLSASTVTRDTRHLNFADLKSGDPVVVHYRNDNGNYIADTVTRSDASVTK